MNSRNTARKPHRASNRIKHLNGTANGNGVQPEQAIPLTDAELSTF